MIERGAVAELLAILKSPYVGVWTLILLLRPYHASPCRGEDVPSLRSAGKLDPISFGRITRDSEKACHSVKATLRRSIPVNAVPRKPHQVRRRHPIELALCSARGMTALTSHIGSPGTN